MFHSNQKNVSKILHRHRPADLAGIHGERAWQGRGQFQGVRSVCHFCTRMAGWLVGWLGSHSSDVISPGFGFVPTLTQPTGSSAAVSQAPVTQPLPSCMHVCVCVCSALRSLLICYTNAPPHPSPSLSLSLCALWWYELWKQWVVGCVPARECLSDYSLPLKVDSPHLPLLCSLSRTT